MRNVFVANRQTKCFLSLSLSLNEVEMNNDNDNNVYYENKSNEKKEMTKDFVCQKCLFPIGH